MKDIKEMDLNELVDFFTGRACIAIGKGDLRGEICTIITCSMQLGADNVKEFEKSRKQRKGA